MLSRLERGKFGNMRLQDIETVAQALGADLDMRIRWHGEDLDRLLDAVHAALVEFTLGVLTPFGWEAIPEVTFSIGGERGSIDILAWHARTQLLLVIEVKSVVPDMQQMFAAFDRKCRLARSIAAQRGWQAKGVARMLVMPSTRTNRRRIEQFGASLKAILPTEGPALRVWIADPSMPCPSALWLVSDPAVLSTARVRRVRVR